MIRRIRAARQEQLAAAIMAAEIEAHSLVLGRAAGGAVIATPHSSADYILDLADRIRAERAAAERDGKGIE